MQASCNYRTSDLAEFQTVRALSPWEHPSRPWIRIHADFAGALNNTYYLIVIDPFSNWPEVVPMKKITTANTIEAFENIFTQHGHPIEIVTDNGTQFTSQDFIRFCEAHSIKKFFSAPYFPQSNGRAERMVDIFKRSLAKMQNEGNMSTIIRKFLKLTAQLHPKRSTEKLLLKCSQDGNSVQSWT